LGVWVGGGACGGVGGARARPPPPPGGGGGEGVHTRGMISYVSSCHHG